MRPFLLVALLLVLSLPAAPAAAQTVGDCDRESAERDLDANNVRARVFNRGNLFFGNTTTVGDGYLVPAATGRSPIFAANFWVGGWVDGELRLTAAAYSNFEFSPGPLDADGEPPADCTAFDRIWVVSRADVARYHVTGVATDDLRDWPVDLGAPVLDGDGVDGNYNLEGGDEPAISGDQTAWWVMNDRGTERSGPPWSLPPLGIEARVEAFAVASPAPALWSATVYRYRLTNRSGQPLDSAYVALWADTDLGDASDDYVGSDTTLNMGFSYNAEDVDASYSIPPAVGIQVVRGPVGLPNGHDDDENGEVDETDERLGMTAFMWQIILSGVPTMTCDELNPRAPYDYMRGRFCGGDAVREGGLGGEEDGPVTKFYYSGDPVAGEFWSEENVDGAGTRSEPGDRRFVVASGPFRLTPGATEEVVFAIPFAQGADRLDSVVELREAARYLRNAYDLGVFDPQRVGTDAEPAPPPESFALSAAPNPFSASASIELTVADGAGPLRLAVYDVLGREVAVLADGTLAPGVHPFRLDGAALPSGTYVVRLETGRQTESIVLTHVD